MSILQEAKTFNKKNEQPISNSNEPLTKVLAKAGQREEQSAFFHFSALVRAGNATLNFSSYLQQNIFKQQRLPADGMLIPKLLKAMPVVRHTN